MEGIDRMASYLYVIAIMLLAYLIYFINHINKIYQKDQQIEKLKYINYNRKYIIINRKKHEDLVIKLRSLITAYEGTSEVPTNWDNFRNDVKQAIIDSDLLVISDTIIKFEYANNIHQIKLVCGMVIKQLEGDNLYKTE